MTAPTGPDDPDDPDHGRLFADEGHGDHRDDPLEADDDTPLGGPHVGDLNDLSDLAGLTGDDPGAVPDEVDIAASTADLDDDAVSLVPDSPPLTLGAVETLLDRRRNEVQISPTLTRISTLLGLLGDPQTSYPVLQVAGTNGKTSTARMIDALLTRLGLRTGRFTSPHLQVVTERIALDGEPIDPDRYVAAFEDLAPYLRMVEDAAARDAEPGTPTQLSKFEVLTAMAYAAFADAPVDAAVVETGLGGTWDSTTVADARVAVITPIDIDHVEYLGPTLTDIARNKAGIIKPESVAVIGPQPPDAMRELLRRAVEVDATVARFDSEFAVISRAFAVGGQRLTLQGLGGVYEDVFLPLAGEHQAVNAATALAAVEAFFGAGASRQLDTEAVQDAFAAVASPGRLERVRTSPTILVDAAHNPAGAGALAAALSEEFSFTRLVGVLAVLQDKDVRGVLEALANSFDEVVVTVNSSPRSMPVAELVELAVDVFGEDRVHATHRMDDALALAVELAETDVDDPSGTAVLVTGSVVSAGDVRTLTGQAPA
ncbi:bifunctional folylpolyglutamate synthase/dihydrofolate synthase [Nakamurella leprariae]|uniref:Dihydrofolate synthase/folylpolyglutamate synthase n=1 Tax=Nakamurella leprariae TaxID=2803911 RepID=A0A938YH81_9ACTN|nr:folylpolyglutamate synthase/dihydrofolate synthase family protein [Nakamurella leprariae]MBM9468074.1 bifunctional folylpolyglutamate synthase/dihydrofolate synthase [Nakamurella leprariae]